MLPSGQLSDPSEIFGDKSARARVGFDSFLRQVALPGLGESVSRAGDGGLLGVETEQTEQTEQAKQTEQMWCGRGLGERIEGRIVVRGCGSQSAALRESV